ncbi:MAG: nitroreductase family protein [Planctomycetota bacterium]|jgi:nitroreductase|nr:nitroreductase family protein [Planctomycetota bacterium]
MHPIDSVISGRRTHKSFGGAAIARSTIDELLGLAIMAPHHRLSNPWRFTVLDQAAIADLASWLPQQDAIVNDPDPSKGPRKVAKLCQHYFPQLGAMIQVTALRCADNPTVDDEDHQAVAAAVQNLLLAAEARGLASFWASSPALRHPSTLRHLGIDPERERFVASVWLGSRVNEPITPPRLGLAEVTRYLSGADDE